MHLLVPDLNCSLKSFDFAGTDASFGSVESFDSVVSIGSVGTSVTYSVSEYFVIVPCLCSGWSMMTCSINNLIGENFYPMRG